MSIYNRLTQQEEDEEEKKKKGLKPSQAAAVEQKRSIYQQLTEPLPAEVEQPEEKKPSLWEKVKGKVKEIVGKKKETYLTHEEEARQAAEPKFLSFDRIEPEKTAAQRLKETPLKEYFYPTSTAAAPAREYWKTNLEMAVKTATGATKLTPAYLIYRAVTGNPVSSKEYLGNVLTTGLEGLGVTWRSSPAAPVWGAAVGSWKANREFLQGKIDAQELLQAPIAGVNEQPGIGEALTDNVKLAEAIDIAFMVTMVGKGVASKTLGKLNLKAEEISSLSKTLGVKPDTPLAKINEIFKQKMKELPDTFTANPNPENVALRTELTNAFNVLKKAGVVEKKYAQAYEFLTGWLKKSETPIKPTFVTPKALPEVTGEPVSTVRSPEAPTAKMVTERGVTTPELPSAQLATQSIEKSIEKAPKYKSAEDFAKAEFSANPTDQIGTINSKEVTARDPIDRAAVDDYKKRINTGEVIEPIEITKTKEGTFETTDGSHRITAYQELGQEAPVIYRGTDPVEGLVPFDKVYSETLVQMPKKEPTKAVEKAPEKPQQKPSEIPEKPTLTKELEPLAKEARKYKSADDFIDSQIKGYYQPTSIIEKDLRMAQAGLSELEGRESLAGGEKFEIQKKTAIGQQKNRIKNLEGILQGSKNFQKIINSGFPSVKDFYNQATKGVEAKEVKAPEAKKVIPPEETETAVSKEVDEFVKELDKNYSEQGFVSLPDLKKPDLKKIGRLVNKIGTREEQIGEDAFWQQELFKTKRETNIRNITREVQEKLAPEKMVSLLSKIPYVDKDAAVRIARAGQRLSFIKEKNRQQLLYKTASAIKNLDESGNPVFGTKIQKVLDDGSVKEDWRYTPAEGKALWDKLTAKERAVLTEYVAPLEKAKTIFSRELLKQKAEVKEGVEGYIHKYYEDKVGDRFKKIFFKYRRAAPTKTRTRYVNPETGKVEELKGNVENFEKAVIKQMENVTNAGEYNKFIEIWQELLTEPLNDTNPLKAGWVEVRGTLKTGIPTDKPRIFKTEEGYSLAPQLRRQVPLAIKEQYMQQMKDASEAHALLSGIRSVARFWQGNVLIYPGTAATNFISGGLQYGTKIITDFYRDGVFSGNFKPFIADITALLNATRPSVIEKLRPEMIGSKVNISTQFGKPENIVDKFLQTGLTPFGMVESYWKRVIADATIRGIGKKPEDILTNYETFKKVSKETDIYGFNYSNIPYALEKWRGSTAGALIYPFATYPYKYGRLLERYTTGAVKELFTGSKKEGFARLMTLASMMSILYFFTHQKEEKVGEYVDEMKYPGEFDKTGRYKIGETDKKESYFRVVKYPWLNFMKVMEAGAGILTGYKKTGLKEISGIGQEFISEGPLLDMANLITGKKDKFSMYKTSGQMFGEVAKSFIPLFRINESISMLINPEKTKQDTFEQAIERALFIKPSGELRTGSQEQELQYNREEEFLKFAFGINIRSIDKAEYEDIKSQVIQNMVYRIEENEDVTPKSKERAIEVLRIFGVDESEYPDYLRARKKRMSKSRK